MKTSSQRLSSAQFHYDNLHEEDFSPVSAAEEFIESTSGSNWLHGQSVTLVSGKDSDYVTQSQFKDYIGERIAGLEWDEDQSATCTDLIITAYTGASGGRNIVKALFGDEGLEGLAEELLISSGAIERYLSH